MAEVTTLNELEEIIFDELSVELQATDSQFSEKFYDVLKSKIKQAIRKVISVRNYPDTEKYDEEYIAKDLQKKFYSNCYGLSLYYYNTIGAEYEKSHVENDLTRSWYEEKTLLEGVTSIARIG